MNTTNANSNVINLFDLVSTESDFLLDIMARERKYNPVKFQGTQLCDFDLIDEPTGEPLQFVWPNEGEMKNGEFSFNEEHKDFEPLFIDKQTQNLLIIGFSKLKPEIREKGLLSIQKSRTKFVRIIEVFWKKVA
jgi:hypothetical protein